MQAVTAHATTLHYFGVGSEPGVTAESGTPVPDDVPPSAGDHIAFTYRLYPGTASHHSPTPTSTMTLDCLITTAHNPNLSTLCGAVLASGASTIVAYGPVRFPGSTHQASILFGTGDWNSTVGLLVGRATGQGTDTEFSIYLRHS